MIYIEIKTIKGRQYKYLRKSVRIGDKVAHTNVQYLGQINSIYKYNKTKKSRKTNASI